MKRLLLILAAILLAPAPALAGPDPDTDWVILKDGAPVTIRPDRAYILYRTSRIDGIVPGMDVVFLRDPTDSEITAYQAARETALNAAKAKRARDRDKAIKNSKVDPSIKIPPEYSEAEFTFRYTDAVNLRRVNNGNQYQKSDTEGVYLVEVKPASYVIAGTAHKMFINVETCNCMGTVRFEAKAGVVTDLGTILTDDVSKVSPIPELAPFTGRGARINGVLLLMVQTVRPYAEGNTLPVTLKDAPRVLAELHAVGKFPNRFATSVNRMAPIPGVLAYDEDRVIDVRTGKTL